MEKTLVITSGHQFVDIDAFACIFAYQELLELKGEDASAVITASLNASITERYRNLDFFERNADAVRSMGEGRQCVIMDTSDPAQFERFADVDHVVKVFDHHPGFEQFWKDRLGENAIIEPIGAAATLIFREYETAGLLEKISPMAAELLAVAILSNTLFFQSEISTDEDKLAYESLKDYFNYVEGFEHDYFSEVQRTIESDMQIALRDDSKRVTVHGVSMLIAQLEVWDADHILSNFSKDIEAFIADDSAQVSFLNLIEIGKGRNHIIFRDVQSLEYLRGYFPEFEYDVTKNIAIAPGVILRKELLTKIYAKIV